MDGVGMGGVGESIGKNWSSCWYWLFMHIGLSFNIFMNIWLSYNIMSFYRLLMDIRLGRVTSWAGLSLPQSLTTQEEHFTTFLAFPSWSILQRPAHSPSFMLESTLINGMPCSMHRAVMSFLYMGSSQFSAKMHRRACLLSRALEASLTPRARPSAIRACFRTSWMAVLISMGPDGAAAEGTSSPSTSDMVSSWMSFWSLVEVNQAIL